MFKVGSSMFLALLLLTSSSGNPERTERQVLVEELRQAVCKVVIPFSGHGSGVAYGQKDGWTYVLTAGHCVRPINPDEWRYIRFSCVHSEGTADISELAEAVAVAPHADLAVLRIRNSRMACAHLGGLHPVAAGTEVLAIGYPGPLNPSIVTYGFMLNTGIEAGQELFQHSAAIYFGNSGGGLFRFDDLSLIGINVEMPFVSEPWRSDLGKAVSIKEIYAFLAEVHRDELEKVK